MLELAVTEAGYCKLSDNVCQVSFSVELLSGLWITAIFKDYLNVCTNISCTSSCLTVTFNAFTVVFVCTLDDSYGQYIYLGARS